MARRTRARLSPDPDVAAAAALVADPIRAAMLCALLGGGEFSASELAFRAGASAQAASAHLAKLVAGGMLVAKPVGRQRLFRLASAEIGHAIEALAAIARPARVQSLSQDLAVRRLREARSCYDHLAGRIGVAITDRLVDREFLRLHAGQFDLTRRGEAFFIALEIDVDYARAQRRSFARVCIDWTERRPHLAGSLGASLLEHVLSARWLERSREDRALRVTLEGRVELARRFGVEA